jgi:hypothetical protein
MCLSSGLCLAAVIKIIALRRPNGSGAKTFLKKMCGIEKSFFL